MKNKPHSHRQSNTFRFRGFHEKVKNIRISAKNYVLQKLNSDTESETLLWQTIYNLKEENLTKLFCEFQTALGIEIQTLAQLLHHESRVANIIKTFLERADKDSLQAMISCLTSFARDTENIFYKKYFYEFLPILHQLLTDNVKCNETIENVFIGFMSLFYIFQKYLNDDFYKLYVKFDLCTLFGKQYPSYVNELAAQSLCSLLRKTSNADVFGLCLKRLTKHEDETDGVGRLLFHSLKSDVARRLHSSASSSFSTLLDLVIEGKVERERAEKAILYCLKQLMLHATSSANIPHSWQVSWKDDSKHIWPVIYKKLDHYFSGTGFEDDSLIFILNVICDITDFKHAELVTDCGKLFEVLTSLTKLEIGDETGNCISKIVAKLLCSAKYNDSLSNVLHKFLDFFFEASFTASVIFNFIDDVVTSQVFDKDILPQFLRFVVRYLNTEEKANGIDIIDCIFKIINTNVSPVRTMEDMELWAKYEFDFTPRIEDEIQVDRRTPSSLLESILSEGLASDLSNIEIIIKCCVCLPHIGHENVDFVPTLFWIMNDAFEMIQNEGGPKPIFKEETEPPKKKRRKSIIESPSKLNQNINVEIKEDPRKLAFLLSVVVETLYHTISSTDFISALSEMKLISILKERVQYRDNVHLLKALDIQLSVLAMEEDALINENTLADFFSILAPSLASHKPLVRLLVSHIFTLFPYERVSSNLAESQLLNMFSVMFEVEAAPFSPLDSKERLRLLSRLDVNNANLSRPASELYGQAPLLFLIGQLYINFKDMWTPVLRAISQYAYALPTYTFWALWADKLKIASHYALKSLCNKNVEEEDQTSFEDTSLNGYHTDLISLPGYSQLNTKPNYRNFRDLLWQAMHQFPDICERNHKDVVALFMKFLEDELFPVDYTVAPTQDISVHDEEADVEDVSGVKDESPEDEATVDPSKRVRKAPTKSLCEHLILFSKFHNPKVISKTKELEERFCEFLSHPYAKAQKLALDAIMAYKHKFLVPYKESLYNILDDKSFKNEITLFDIEGKDEDDAKSLKEEHRTDFMPYLMRILYGKMFYKTGSRTAGKNNIGVRKGTVLRFLAGANESELNTFLNLSFDIFLSEVNGSALDVVERVEEHVDPKKVVPLKRMQGALGTLDVIFEKLGCLLINKRSFLLKIILFILGSSVTLLDKRTDVCSHFSSLLKNNRKMGLQMVIMFFNNFEKYRWSNNELEAIFRASVWPSLPKLPIEGISGVTPLMKLFACWASNPDFHVLLSRHQREDTSLMPLPYMIKLINHPKCESKVVDKVYEIIEKLLKGQKSLPQDVDDVNMEEDEFEPFELPLENILPLDQRAKERGLLNLTWGECIVLSSLDELLLNIKNSLSGLKNDDTVKKEVLTTLIHVAQWITNEKDAEELLGSVVPLLKKNCVKQIDKVVYLLNVCCNLVGIVNNPERYTNEFICMFSTMSDRNCRLALCDVIKVLFKADDDVVAKWCFDLNSYTGEMMEEINAEKRLNCFREISKYLKETDCYDERVILFLIHQNIWVLNQAGNQGLNDLSVLCLQLLLDTLVCFHCESPMIVKKIFDYHLLPLLKSGLKNKNEGSRDSMMKVLGSAVHKCHKFHRRLKDLFLLADVNDPEADFFLNMHHLQRSRRAKALSRVATTLSEGKLKLQTETISEFILPAASVYLFKEEYATDNNLLTSCVTCIGALARVLPWYYYQNLLKYYLNLFSRELSQLKLGVRVLEAVLDAFHEEISDFEPSSMDTKLITTEEEAPDVDANDEMELNEGNDEDDTSKQDSINKAYKKEKIYWTLTQVFIPRIQKVLSERSVRDTEHKVNKKKYPEDEDIKRIPLALALIKLLKRLPKKDLKLHVNNVLMKLIDYLKSRLESIRKEAREMLVKVMKELGGDYLYFMVSDLKNILTRGYQIHILVFTLHAILVSLQSTLESRHIAPCIVDIMEICIEDIFGDKAEEKLVSQITKKVKEAKPELGFSIMGQMAHIIPVDQIENIISPLKDKLQTHDSKVVNKVACCLQKIGIGLERNSYISKEHKSLFVYTLLKEKINCLTPNGTNEASKPEAKKQLVIKDSYLIEPEPRRVGMAPKTDRKTTIHILVEFALNILSNLLKHNHFDPTNKNHCGLLDVYVGIISNCLLSEYPEVSIQALHVISHLIKFPLPSLRKNMPTMFGKMFVILNRFASSEMGKNKLFQLVQLDFKVIALIIKAVTFYKVETDHAKVLINYADINLKDFNQYHSSFVILNAFINRKLSYPELHEVMAKIQEQSIKSTNLNMLDQARRCYLNYHHNFKKRKQQNIDNFLFYVGNLSYEIACGRMSAILAVQELIAKDVTAIIDHKTEVAVLLAIAEQILKETSKEHKTLLKKILKILYAKSCRKNALIDECVKKLSSNLLKSNSDNALAIHLGTECLMPMIDLNNSEHASSLFDQVFPKLVDLIHPNRFIEGENIEDDVESQCLDLALNSLMDLLLLMVEFHFKSKNFTKWAESVDENIWKHVQHHLLYPNLKVRLTAAIIFGKLFGSYPVTGKAVPLVAANTDMVENLVIDFCQQLITQCSVESPVLNELGLSVVRNLVYLISQGRKVPIKIKSDNEQEGGAKSQSKNSDNKNVSFTRFTKRKPEENAFLEGAHRVLECVGIIAYDELKVEGIQTTFRRECFLNLIAGVVVILAEDLEKTPNIVSFIIRHVSRELSDKSLPEILQTRTKEVEDFMKERIGVQRYNEVTVRSQAKMDKKRTRRKARERERVVSNPELALKKKVKKHLEKKEAKKRKYAELKLLPNKKRRLKDIA